MTETASFISNTAVEVLAVLGAAVLCLILAIAIVFLVDKAKDAFRKRAYKTCRNCGAINRGYKYGLLSPCRGELVWGKFNARYCPACGEELEVKRDEHRA